MSAQELLDRAKNAGLSVEPIGDRLRVRGPRDERKLAQLLIDRKAEIIPLLTATKPCCGATECGDGDETSPFSDETGVSSPAVNQTQKNEPPTPDQIQFWLDCLRETGCEIALVDGAPWIRWPAGIATPGRLRDWQANLDTITAVLESEKGEIDRRRS